MCFVSNEVLALVHKHKTTYMHTSKAIIRYSWQSVENISEKVMKSERALKLDSEYIEKI